MDLKELMKSYRNLIIRCPRLGGEVTFSYCEREAGELPCRQVIGCWGPSFPVAAYFREILAPEAWKRFCSQVPAERMTTLIDLIEAARQRSKSQE